MGALFSFKPPPAINRLAHARAPHSSFCPMAVQCFPCVQGYFIPRINFSPSYNQQQDRTSISTSLVVSLPCLNERLTWKMVSTAQIFYCHVSVKSASSSCVGCRHSLSSMSCEGSVRAWTCCERTDVFVCV